jgi:hypothetical protein
MIISKRKEEKILKKRKDNIRRSFFGANIDCFLLDNLDKEAIKKADSNSGAMLEKILRERYKK